MAPRRGGGGEVGLADGEEVGVEGGDVVVLGSRLVRGRGGVDGNGKQGRYYSVCFFKEFITRVGAFAGGRFQFGIVFAEEGVEEGS